MFDDQGMSVSSIPSVPVQTIVSTFYSSKSYNSKESTGGLLEECNSLIVKNWIIMDPSYFKERSVRAFTGTDNMKFWKHVIRTVRK